MMKKNGRDGLSLIELMITLVVLAVVARAGFLALNPAGQIAGARNSQRVSYLQVIVLAIRENMASHTGQIFSCGAGPLPTSTKKIASGAGNYDIASCLTAYGLAVMPFDPTASGAHYASSLDYDTGFNVVFNASTSQVTLSAPSAELGKSISLTR